MSIRFVPSLFLRPQQSTISDFMLLFFSSNICSADNDAYDSSAGSDEPISMEVSKEVSREVS